jgi:hypothetical protein
VERGIPPADSRRFAALDPAGTTAASAWSYFIKLNLPKPINTLIASLPERLTGRVHWPPGKGERMSLAVPRQVALSSSAESQFPHDRFLQNNCDFQKAITL